MPTYIKQNILDRIDAIDFFVNCGRPTSMPIQALEANSWVEAGNAAGGTTWGNKVLDESEDIRQALKSTCPDDYRFWNKMAAEAREYIKTTVKPKIQPYATSSSLDNVLLDSVSWDIVNIIIIYSFDVESIETKFFDELISVYEFGKFPCGWKGKYRKGSLIVY